jgi:mannose-1-phosphate guanylyltransferase
MGASELHAVIMAGGAGTRFWPASRASRPKQFLPISGARTMIAETFARLAGLVPRERVWVVSAASQADLVRTSLPELPPENLLCEPEARNTAPCVALAAHAIALRVPESVQVVLPADHVVDPSESFRRTLAAGAEEAAADDVLITFGIRPTFPATGYGYVEAGPALHERTGIPVHSVVRFVEKPDLASARRFVECGRFLWNSGMFAWSTRAIQAALHRHVPAIAMGMERLRRGEPLAQVYGTLPSVAIDTAVMERADNVRMLPIDYRWSDVGSWTALAELHAQDADGNACALSAGARLLAEDARGCVVYAEGPELVALLGVRDLVVVRAGDVTLVCPTQRAQDVKRLVERLQTEGPSFL